MTSPDDIFNPQKVEEYLANVRYEDLQDYVPSVFAIKFVEFREYRRSPKRD